MSDRTHRLGDLEPLAEWLETVRGDRPGGLHRPALVLFCGDHGLATHDISTYAPGYSARRLRSIQAGQEAVSRLAEARGVAVTAVDVALDHTQDGIDASPTAAPFSPSHAADATDAATESDVARALALGATVADAEIDHGSDILLLGDLGRGSTAIAATLVSIIVDVEPVKCVGRGSGIDDEAWMRKMTAVRDARRRGMPARRDTVELLQRCGGTDFAAGVGFLRRAAERHVPVILDGVVGAAVALLTHQLNPEASRSWQIGRRSDEPAQQIAVNGLGLRPILDLTLPFGEGIGALLALSVLQAAATLAETR